MIDINLDIVPFGFESQRRSIGRIQVINTGTGTKEFGNYKIVITDKGQNYTFFLDKFKRDLGIFVLLELALEKYNSTTQWDNL